MKKIDPYKLFLYVFSLIIVLLPVFILWAKDMPLVSYEGLVPAYNEEQLKLAKQYEEEITFFAKKPRNFEYMEHYVESKEYIVNKLKSYGYEVVTQKYEVNGNSYENIEVTIPSFKNKEDIKEPIVVIGAHYDSFSLTPGADDNASATVVLLELAKRFKDNFKSNGQSIKLVFFANEEPPFFGTEGMGSDVYAKSLKESGVNVAGMYSLEMLGFYKEEEGSQHYPFIIRPFFKDKGDFVGFVSNIESRELTKEAIKSFREVSKFPSEGITAPPSLIRGIDFSDNISFYKYGYKAIMVTDTAFLRNYNYHLPSDKVETLDYKKMAMVTDYLELMFRKMYEK